MAIKIFKRLTVISLSIKITLHQVA